MWIVAGIAIVCIIIAGIWLLGTRDTSDPIVGTWTDKNNYWAYAYYGNGSILELGWYTHKTGNTSTYVPVYSAGTWASLGNGHYSIIPDNSQNTTIYEAVISGKNMSVLNMSSGDTHKISSVPDVTLVSFNYIP